MTGLNEEEKKAMLILNNISVKILSDEENEAIVIIENLIQKQDTEINKLNNIIDKLVKRIKYDTEWFYSDLDNKSEEEIKEYFMKDNEVE